MKLIQLQPSNFPYFEVDNEELNLVELAREMYRIIKENPSVFQYINTMQTSGFQTEVEILELISSGKSLRRIAEESGRDLGTLRNKLGRLCNVFLINKQFATTSKHSPDFIDRIRIYIHRNLYWYLHEETSSRNYQKRSNSAYDREIWAKEKEIITNSLREIINNPNHEKYKELEKIAEVDPQRYQLWIDHFINNIKVTDLSDKLGKRPIDIYVFLKTLTLWLKDKNIKKMKRDSPVRASYSRLLKILNKHPRSLKITQKLEEESKEKKRVDDLMKQYSYKGKLPPRPRDQDEEKRIPMWYKLQKLFDSNDPSIINNINRMRIKYREGFIILESFYGLFGKFMTLDEIAEILNKNNKQSVHDHKVKMLKRLEPFLNQIES